MRSSHKKMAIIAVIAVAATVIGTTSMAFGSVKPGTKVTAKNVGNVTFTGTLEGVPITVTCKSFTDSVTVTSSDKTSAAIPPPKITKCTDSSTGTDTIATTGKWKLTVNSSGTTVTLVVPKDGATFKSSIFPGCVVQVAPKGPVNIAGSWNSSNGEDTVSGDTIAVTGKGCSASNATATATEKFTPNPGTIPPFAS
jgi:hypothetical protein